MERLRRAMREAGYTGDALGRMFGSVETTPDGRLNLALYLRRLAEPSPLHTLVKLFVLGVEVGEPEARAAFGSARLQEAAATGLVERSGGACRSPVSLTASHGLLLAHDRSGEGPRGLSPDHVLGLGPSPVTVINFTPRPKVAATLDLGTGSGVQALLAARHSQRVVATDVNPRALNLAAFNAALNGVTNVEWREGDWFGPVAGERFDLVVCNPPYVISPESAYLFRDGGVPGHGVSEPIVRAAPAHLAEGGVAVVLCNWGQPDGQDWSSVPLGWVRESGCDAWLLHNETIDPLTYAAAWNRGLGPPGYERALDAWAAYYRDLGFAAIGAGVVLLRRRAAAPHWVRTDEVPDMLAGAAGEQMERILQAQDLLSDRAGDGRLLGRALELAGDHRIEQVLAHRDGRYAVDEMQVRLLGGLGFRMTLDPLSLRLLTSFDGQRSLVGILDEIAAGADGHMAERARSAARRLLGLGFVTPRPA